MNTEAILYLYGFVSAAADVASIAGVEDESEVFLVAEGDVACAATAVPALEYRRPADGLTAEQQLEWVTPRAWRHHQALRTLHAADAVVPLKFGTLSPGVDHVRTLLHRLRDPITDMLAQFSGRDEWTLRSRFDREALSCALHDPRLESASVPAAAAGGLAYLARKRLQKLTAELLAARTLEIEYEIHERLTQSGIEVAQSARPARTSDDGRHAITESALLVRRQEFEDVQSSLGELEAEYARAGVTFELIGPWPPYAFTSTLDAMEAPGGAA